MTVDEIAALLADNDPANEERLFADARSVRRECGRDAILPRGLVEVSNVCAKNCLYCGIRKGNCRVSRFHLAINEILACCDEAKRRGHSAVAFQAGEIESEANTGLYECILREIAANGTIREVTLSLGEQTEEVYRRWKAAAGDLVLRYLLRIESSNRAIYERIHPIECSFDRRVECVRTLKRLGYVTGSGVMIGLPGQTVRNLAEDILFFKRENLDMVGMGPFVPHEDTPLGREALALGYATPERRNEVFRLALRMIAVTRLVMRDINIVAATALETFDPQGREKGLAAGANVIMPNLTPGLARASYQLYPGKSTAD